MKTTDLEAKIAGKNFIEADEGFGAMMISAIRYGLWRRTYITGLTSDYLIPLVNKGLFSRKTLVVMDEDLTRYENDRADRLADGTGNKWVLDDDCDFEAWKALHVAIQTKLKEEEPKPNPAPAEWEDVPEEPKALGWRIDIYNDPEEIGSDFSLEELEYLKEIGLWFKTKEETELAIRKLKAWHKLMGYWGTEILGWEIRDMPTGGNWQTVNVKLNIKARKEPMELLDLLLEGEE